MGGMVVNEVALNPGPDIFFFNEGLKKYVIYEKAEFKYKIRRDKPLQVKPLSLEAFCCT